MSNTADASGANYAVICTCPENGRNNLCPMHGVPIPTTITSASDHPIPTVRDLILDLRAALSETSARCREAEQREVALLVVSKGLGDEIEAGVLREEALHKRSKFLEEMCDTERSRADGWFNRHEATERKLTEDFESERDRRKAAEQRAELAESKLAEAEQEVRRLVRAVEEEFRNNISFAQDLNKARLNLEIADKTLEEASKSEGNWKGRCEDAEAKLRTLHAQVEALPVRTDAASGAQAVNRDAVLALLRGET